MIRATHASWRAGIGIVMSAPTRGKSEASASARHVTVLYRRTRAETQRCIPTYTRNHRCSDFRLGSLESRNLAAREYWRVSCACLAQGTNTESLAMSVKTAGTRTTRASEAANAPGQQQLGGMSEALYDQHLQFDQV